MTRKKLLTGAVLAALMSTCNTVFAAPTLVGGVYPNTINPVKSRFESDPPAAHLGYGYSSDNGQPLSITALNPGGLPILGGGNTGVVDSSIHYDLDTVMQQLHITAHGHFGYSIFSGEAEAAFTQSMERDDLSESFIYRTTLGFKNLTFVLPPNTSYLSLQALNLWNQGGPVAFKNTYGNAYVSQMNYGAYLYLSLQFHFLTQQDRTTFDAAIKGGDVLKIDTFQATLNYVFEHNNIQGDISVVGMQDGGQAQYLSDIIPENAGVCLFRDYKKCGNLLADMVSYLKTGGANPNPRLHFPDQFSSTIEGGIPNNAANTDFNIVDYSKLGYPIDNYLTADVVNARDALANALIDMQTQLQRANFLMETVKDTTYAFDIYKPTLQRTIALLKSNINNLQIAGDVCFNDLKTCSLSWAQNKIKSLGPIDPSALQLPDSFYITETDSKGNLSQKVFAIFSRTYEPLYDVYRGADISSGSSTYDAQIQGGGSNMSVNIVALLPVTRALVATYVGQNMGNGLWSGTVQYASGESRTWTARFVQSKNMQLHLTNSKVTQEG